MPHLDFAVAVEGELPTVRNPSTGKTEVYMQQDGVWVTEGADSGFKGEVLSEASMK